MPNWCSNSFTVCHQDPEMIRKFARGVNDGNLFETLIPLSSGEWDYNTAVEEWGTKWDISGGDVNVSEDGKSADGWFETAWSPAIAAYEKLEELGYVTTIKSAKKRHPACQVVRRKGKIYVINKVEPRYKARQG